jgi:hypothetical protein
MPMPLDDRAKLMLLLCSEQNPMWQGAPNIPNERGKLLTSLGLNFQTVGNWERGRSVSDEKIETVLKKARLLLGLGSKSPPPDVEEGPEASGTGEAAETTQASRPRHEREQRRLEVKLQKARELLLRTPLPRGAVYEFGAVLGMSRDLVQEILDTSIYRAFPLFRHLFLPRELEVPADVRQILCGTYRLYLEREGSWLRSALRVRYPLSVQHYWTLRCKLHVPRIRGGKPLFKYDGFLTPRLDRPKLNWVLEERSELLADLLYVITNRPLEQWRIDPTANSGAIGGRYLSCGQDLAKSIVEGRVLIVPQDHAREQVTDFMENDPVFLGDSDEHRQERTWVEARLEEVEVQLRRGY